ncbi:MAG: hypothetical protein CMO80_17795 [Verrucomicrobiales bacterium]|nr:hypothetical protein [Verrucomicrobiales bacterium]|tara:strand:- start:179 stop:412 length:234 start_codon:yes stop_codon:yes gene_type:complete
MTRNAYSLLLFFDLAFGAQAARSNETVRGKVMTPDGKALQGVNVVAESYFSSGRKMGKQPIRMRCARFLDHQTGDNR